MTDNKIGEASITTEPELPPWFLQVAADGTIIDGEGVEHMLAYGSKLAVYDTSAGKTYIYNRESGELIYVDRDEDYLGEKIRVSEGSINVNSEPYRERKMRK